MHWLTSDRRRPIHRGERVGRFGVFTDVLPLGSLFLCGWLLAPAMTFAAEPEKPRAAHDAGNCELILEGMPIEKLVLCNERGESQEFLKPGGRVRLPPGRYAIEEVELQGGYSAYPTGPGRPTDSLVLTPDKPCRPQFVEPPTPVVTAKRVGRILALSFELSGTDGWQYHPTGSAASPQFAVYQGERLVGSGSFEYG